MPFFNPAGNTDQESRLRLINPGEMNALATLSGWTTSGATRLTEAFASRCLPAHRGRSPLGNWRRAARACAAVLATASASGVCLSLQSNPSR